jgi:hypothetical protein
MNRLGLVAFTMLGFIGAPRIYSAPAASKTAPAIPNCSGVAVTCASVVHPTHH